MTELAAKDAEIERLKAELDAARRRQSEMEDMAKIGELAANMAHEIRNPLAGISSLTEVLRDRLDMTQEDEEIISMILEEVERLNRIVKDLLRFARPAKAYLVAMDLLGSVRQAITLVKERAAKENFKIREELPESCPLVMADADQLRQVFLNILINGMDAAGPGGEMTVSVKPAQEERCVEIAFKDSGPGIPAEAIDKIFDPFFTTKTQGTGLGLAACKKIIEHHGGTIEVTSSPGEGATFTIRLPMTMSQTT